MSGSTSTVARRRTWAPVVIAGGGVGWGGFVAMIIAQHPYGVVGVVALVVFFASWLTARVLTRDIAERRADQVDEYEFDQRTEVRNVGYVVTLGTLLVLFVLLMVAVTLAEAGSPGLLHQAPHFALATFMLGASAPTLLMLGRTRRHADDHDIDDEGEV